MTTIPKRAVTTMRRLRQSIGVKRIGPAITITVYALLTTIGMFSGGFWAIGGLALAILTASIYTATERRISLPDKNFLAVALLALGWMTLSIGWSKNPDHTIHETLRLSTIFLPLILLTSPALKEKSSSHLLFPIMTLALVIGSMSLGLELHHDGLLQKILRDGQSVLTKYNRGLTYAILLSFPMMAWIASQNFPLTHRKCATSIARAKHGKFVLAVFVMVLLFPATLTESHSGKLALILGLATTLAACLRPKLVTKTLMFIPAALTAWPYLARTIFIALYDKLDALPASWKHRMEIWDYMSWRILEKPWLGWGMGTSQFLPFQEPHGSLYEFAIMPSAHPHNAVTQLWVELGLPGVALGLVFAWLTLRKASHLQPSIAPFALGCWSASISLCLTAYDLWTDSLFAAFALTGFAFSLLDASLRGKKDRCL